MTEPLSAVRPATAADVAQIAACARAAYARYVERIGREPAPMVADFATQVAAGRAVVIDEGPLIVGYAVFYPRGDHLHLENVAVLPDRQGRGVGGRLIDFVEAEARRGGFFAVELYTNLKMTENLRLYPKLGYVETGRRCENGFERVFFRKDLRRQVCWIDSVAYRHADQRLKAVYDAVSDPHGRPDNLYQAFSLRPHTIRPADELYRAVLHNDANRLPSWFAELIGCYVAVLTGCDYALAHHGHNFSHLIGDRERGATLLAALRAGELQHCGEPREVAVLRYVNRLCLQPEQMTAADLATLRTHGWDDGELLEVVQVVAMFSYFTRAINALGITTEGERIGLY